MKYAIEAWCPRPGPRPPGRLVLGRGESHLARLSLDRLRSAEQHSVPIAGSDDLYQVPAILRSSRQPLREGLAVRDLGDRQELRSELVLTTAWRRHGRHRCRPGDGYRLVRLVRFFFDPHRERMLRGCAHAEFARTDAASHQSRTPA